MSEFPVSLLRWMFMSSQQLWLPLISNVINEELQFKEVDFLLMVPPTSMFIIASQQRSSLFIF